MSARTESSDPVAAEHDLIDARECGEVSRRIATNQHEVGKLAGLDRADAILGAQKPRPVVRRGRNRL